jgi:hypothetical protein
VSGDVIVICHVALAAAVKLAMMNLLDKSVFLLKHDVGQWAHFK